MATQARIEPKYCPSVEFYIKANYTSWGKNFKVTDGKLTYADGTAIQTKGGYYVKPLSVGDKLGLVYWDGTITAGGNFLLIKNSTIQTDADYLNYYHEGAYAKILDTAGTTMWFSGAPLQAVYHDGAWDYSTTATNELLPHLWHVI